MIFWTYHDVFHPTCWLFSHRTAFYFITLLLISQDFFKNNFSLRNPTSHHEHCQCDENINKCSFNLNLNVFFIVSASWSVNWICLVWRTKRPNTSGRWFNETSTSERKKRRDSGTEHLSVCLSVCIYSAVSNCTEKNHKKVVNSVQTRSEAQISTPKWTK